MTDRQAVRLLALLDNYANECLTEGASLSEAGDLTLRMIANDLIGSLPSHETVDLPSAIRVITGD